MRENTIKIIDKALETNGKAFFDTYYDHPNMEDLKAQYPAPAYKVFYSPNGMHLFVTKA